MHFLRVKPLAAIAVLMCGTLITFETVYCAKSEEPSEENLSLESNDADAFYALMKIHTGYPDHLQQVPTQITEEFVQKVRRNKQRNLICTYLHNGLIQMELTKFLFDAYIDTEGAANAISEYKETVQKMLSSLYEIGALKSKAIVSYYLYINLMNRYPKSVNWDGKSQLVTLGRAVELHQRVLRQLNDAYADCDKLDRSIDFDSSISAFGRKKKFTDDDDRQRFIEAVFVKTRENCADVREVMNKNIIAKNGNRYYDKMWIERLLIKDLVERSDIWRLKTEYDKDFEWWRVVDDTVLSRSTDAQRLHTDKDSVETLINYLEACVDYLKIFMIRFNLKLVECVKQLGRLAGTAAIGNGYIRRWQGVLTDFIKFVHLKNDRFFNDLLSRLEGNSFDLYYNGVEETKGNLQSELESILSNTFTGSTCTPIVLDVEPGHAIIALQKKTENTIGKARQFVDNMKYFLDVDFRIIQTIIGLKNV